ncbi:hypothetical protein A5893_09790 [Pedobacter psychrophilus]|uniref:Uncharacterized protein n=1 Tax=Pedobacter psychrophilus TaxID=1826909 RepID=A0A179DGD5_9SPHI|nr:hypothetical protein [Pedobacter psychrophilus]OAQ39852.1 hypothetical protein A5893_09790 [Pedobacter psychrophilus]
MSDRFKKIFLGCSIAIPFILYSVYYYSIMIKNAPYKFVEFEGLSVKSGLGTNYDKTYSSETQQYQYLNTRDSSIKMKVKLSKDDMLYVHRKAAELGLWNWPEKMLGDSTNRVPRYYLEFDYQRKKKVIEIDADYNKNIKLRDAAMELIKTVDGVIEDAADKQKN